jgi:hypothetical protein
MTDYRVAKGEAQEDQITASIEKFTAQIPSSIYLALSLGSMAASLAFQAAKNSMKLCSSASGPHLSSSSASTTNS